MTQMYALAGTGSRSLINNQRINRGQLAVQAPVYPQLHRLPRSGARLPHTAPPQATPKATDSDTKAGRQPLPTYKQASREQASLRAEVEAPFRSLRLVLFGFATVSAILATLFSVPQIIGTLVGAPNAKPVSELIQDVAINTGALGVCGALLRNDLQAREKQMARLMREDQLGACQIELANKRVLRLGQLRGAARPVVIAGSPTQVAAALEAAEPFKAQLANAGVLVICLPIFEEPSTSSGDAAPTVPALTPEDLRWRAEPIRLDEWKKWFNEQASAAGKTVERGLYLSLRMDGRVRGSGQGQPPWERMAAALPPTEGFFGGLLDGMDGRV